MTGKSLRELRDQIPAVGGGLENRLLELSVGITGDTLQQDIEAAALFLHEIYDALTAQADELATLRAENEELKAAKQRARDSFGHATTQGGCQCVLCTKDWDGAENLMFDHEWRAVKAEQRAEAAEAELAQLQAAVKDLPFVVAQLRHAYHQLIKGAVSNQVAFGLGLIGPQVETLERIQRALVPTDAGE